MNKFNWGMRGCSVLLLWAATAVALPAQTFTRLHSFDSADGQQPEAALVQTTNGDLYGITTGGGANGTCNGGNGCGTVFKITTGGTLSTVYNFCSQSNCTDGELPFAGLIQGTDGNLYGTTLEGGTGINAGCGVGCGTVFKITDGTLTTLYSFCSQTNCTDGANPEAGLVQGTDGNFYGTTEYGGVPGGSCTQGLGCGTVFTITPSGALTTLHSFDVTDGQFPIAGLIQGTDGNFYGTMEHGGANFYNCGEGCGTVFKITASGTLTTLYNFCSHTFCTDGVYSHAGLVQGTDGNFYGTTSAGGTANGGTVFTITPSGTLTTLHSLGLHGGGGPEAGLIQGTDGNFYGTTEYGGTNGAGTAFKITPSGKATALYNFCSQSNCTDGELPFAPLLQNTNGKFYGTTTYGGTNGYFGTVFSLSVGLRPFVETQPTSGTVGAAVNILGTSLTGATSVTFNGISATFTVKSKSEITTTVPTGATTGTVQVVTSKGTLSSNVPFRVLP